MPAVAHILSLSSIEILRQTRHDILARHFRVTSVTGVDQLRQLTPATPFHVAVFCHTLSPAECRSTAAIFRKRWPRAKLLALTAHHEPCSVQHPDALVAALEGPEAWLHAIKALLATGTISRSRMPRPDAAYMAPVSHLSHR